MSEHLNRVLHHEFDMKIELKQGTFEMFGHINSDGDIDYDFFLDQKHLDCGCLAISSADTSESFCWQWLVCDILKTYDFNKKRFF